MEVAVTMGNFLFTSSKKTPTGQLAVDAENLLQKLLVRSQDTTESAPKPPSAINDREIQVEMKRARCPG